MYSGRRYAKRGGRKLTRRAYRPGGVFSNFGWGYPMAYTPTLAPSTFGAAPMGYSPFGYRGYFRSYYWGY